MSFLDRFKREKNKEDEELDILEELDEPFSFDQFIEEQVVDRYKEFRKLLEEQGILFFLLSPFQYRNRLLIKLAVVFFGIVLGVIPRSMSLVNEAKDRNASSELAQIEDSSFQVGNMAIRPLASSQYNEQHFLTFLIEGETSDGVPSTIDRYDVDLFPLRGVYDEENVHYRYDILPIDNSQRMLMVYVDNRKQDDDTGIFGLTVQISGDEFEGDNTMEVVLSDSQETNALFDRDGVDLAVLTEEFIGQSNISIEEVEEELEEALSGYELMVDRLQADGYQLGMNSQAIEDYVEEYTILSGLTDNSTVRNIPEGAEKMDELDENQEEINLDLISELEIDGRLYRTDDEGSDLGRSDYDSVDEQAILELEDLQTQANEVTTALKKLNDARKEKYDSLVEWQRILNKDINPEEFEMHATAAEEVIEGVAPEDDDDLEEEIIDARDDIKVDPKKDDKKEDKKEDKKDDEKAEEES